MDMIKDGTGKGYLARVGSNNRIDVSAKINDRIYYVSRDDEKAFMIHFSSTGGSAVQGMGYLTYTGNKKLIINKVTLATEEGTGMTIFGLKVGTTVSGGDSVTPTNLNLSSAETLEVTSAHDGDGTGVTITGGTGIGTIRLNQEQTFNYNFNDAFIMGKNDTFAINVGTETASTKTRAFIRCYEEDI